MGKFTQSLWLYNSCEYKLVVGRNTVLLEKFREKKNLELVSAFHQERDDCNPKMVGNSK